MDSCFAIGEFWHIVIDLLRSVQHLKLHVGNAINIDTSLNEE